MKTKEKTPVKTWEYKDRNYYLKGSKEPISFKLGSRHTRRHPLLWFDNEKGYNRELRYATNQKSVFVDEQNGPATLSHIIFENGSLTVPKESVQLQQMLSLYHPAKGQIYEEFDAVVQAEDQYDMIELELGALNVAYEMGIEQAEAILRVELGSIVSNMSSKEIKRDILMFAKKRPKAFLSLAEDENVELRNYGIKACELNILKLSQDQRTFQWASNGRKLFTIPFDENPYSALAAWFKTDEGVDVYKAIEKKLK